MKFKPKRKIISINEIDKDFHMLKCCLPLYIVYNDINSKIGTTTKCHHKSNIQIELPFIKVEHLKSKKIKGVGGKNLSIKEIIKYSLCDEYFIKKFFLGLNYNDDKTKSYLKNKSADSYIFSNNEITSFIEMLNVDSYNINYNNSTLKDENGVLYVLPENIEIVIVDPDFRRMKIDSIMKKMN